MSIYRSTQTLKNVEIENLVEATVVHSSCLLQVGNSVEVLDGILQ